MNVHQRAVAAIVAACVCGQVLPSAASEVSRRFDWTGVHIGGHLGSLSNTGGVTQLPMNPNAQAYFDSNVISPNPIDGDRSTAFGAQLGYDYQTGPVVFGVEADVSFTRIAGASSDEKPFVLSTTVQSTADRKLDGFATLRARLGVMPFERTLIYATGGFALGRATLANTLTIYNFTHTPICGAATGLCAAGNTSKWLTGWSLGGGLEQAFADNWSVKIEGLYYDLGTLTRPYDDPTAPPGNYALFGASATFKGSVVRVSLNYRFD